MGGSPYWYYVPYEDDKNSALNKLRNKEFEAGRYYPVMDDIDFPVTGESECPGKQHKTIEEAIEAAEENGTRSILDIHTVSDEDDYCIARILTEDELEDYFGTIKPDKQTIEDSFDNFMDDIERGQALCITVYENELPSELFFVGYSFD
jgi:hypothetical protein